MDDVAGRFARRRAALRARLAEAGVDALLVTALVNVRYLTGFTGSAATLLVTADGAGDVFVTDGRYREQAAGEVAGLARLESRGTEWLPDRLGDRGRLGLESHVLPWDRARALAQELRHVAVVPAPAHVEALRMLKDDAELDAVRRACAAADAALGVVLAQLRPGVTEAAVARRLDDELRARSEGPAFRTIVASGPNTARPHHTPGERRLAPGDLVLADLGARVDGYASDMTRTAVLGPAGPDQARLHALVLRAQRAGVAAALAGAEAGAVDAACRAPVDAAGHGEDFVHPSGHALGLEVLEQPVLRAGAADTLRGRMTVTVEPGVYVPGLGGVRIEDTIAVAPDGSAPDVLTRTPTELLVL